jgi:hypothetical protein
LVGSRPVNFYQQNP